MTAKKPPGTIRINGHDATTEQSAVRRSFGIVFQDPSLDDELTANDHYLFTEEGEFDS